MYNILDRNCSKPVLKTKKKEVTLIDKPSVKVVHFAIKLRYHVLKVFWSDISFDWLLHLSRFESLFTNMILYYLLVDKIAVRLKPDVLLIVFVPLLMSNNTSRRIFLMVKDSLCFRIWLLIKASIQRVIKLKGPYQDKTRSYRKQNCEEMR